MDQVMACAWLGNSQLKQNNVFSVLKFRKIFIGPTYKVLRSFTVISDNLQVFNSK